MASPLESSRAPVAADAAESASLKLADAAEVSAPAATSEIKSGLDAGTRESLGRLAQLIRKQIPLDEDEDGVAASDSAKAETTEAGYKREDEAKREKMLKTMFAKGQGDIPPLQATAKDAFPMVVRLEPYFAQAARARGSRVYSQQKTKDAVKAIMTELENRKTDAGTPDSGTADVSTRRAAA